jgi:hypothetical protein
MRPQDYFTPALAVGNGTLIGVACVVFIICALFWIFGRR